MPVILVLLLASCSSDGSTEMNSTYFHGTITVDTSLDNTGNYSGIGLTLLGRERDIESADTIAHVVTNRDGKFATDVQFSQKGRHPLLITRNGRRLTTSSLILAPDDTVKLTAELPKFGETKEIESREHEAYQTYQRVGKNYNRVRQHLNRQGLTGDTLRDEILKWVDIYWEVKEKYEGTLYGKQAAVDAARLLEGWNDEEMMARLRKIQRDPSVIDAISRLGKRGKARMHGLDSALAYLDTLRQYTDITDTEMSLDLQELELLLDSARVEAADQKLASMRDTYIETDTATTSWYNYYRVEIDSLAPGKKFPEFSFLTMKGDSLHPAQWKGKAYLLEITSVANSMYRNQFDRMRAIHRVFNPAGFEMVTVPLDSSHSNIRNFFAEGGKDWPVVNPSSYNQKEIINKLNIRQIPTRFLVDAEGRIVRKYVGSEIDDVVSDLRDKVKSKEVSL